MPHTVIISVSYGEDESSNSTRTVHLTTSHILTEKLAMEIADTIIESVREAGLFGIYKVEYPAARASTNHTLN